MDSPLRFASRSRSEDVNWAFLDVDDIYTDGYLSSNYSLLYIVQFGLVISSTQMCGSFFEGRKFLNT